VNKFCATVLSLASLSAFAEDKKIVAEAEFGLIMTGGNTETQSTKAKIDVKQELTNWKNHYILEGLNKRDEVENTSTGLDEKKTTAEKYFGSIQSDYKIGKEHAAFFGYADYDRNRFSGFEYQYTLAVGYSDRLFTNDNSYWSYNIGPGVTVAKPDNAKSESTAVIRVATEYSYSFSETAKFTQTVSSNISTDSDKNTKTKAVSSLTAQISGGFSLRASFTVDNNSEVPAGVKHSDTETALTVVYSF